MDTIVAHEKTIRKKKFSYIDQYRQRIEELSSMGVGVASLVRVLQHETGLEIPYNSINNYMKRNNIPRYNG